MLVIISLFVYTSGTHLTQNTLLLIVLCPFLLQIQRYYTITTINPWSQWLWHEKKNILPHNLFGHKIIQNCLQIDAIHSYENDL